MTSRPHPARDLPFQFLDQRLLITQGPLVELPSISLPFTYNFHSDLLHHLSSFNCVLLPLIHSFLILNPFSFYLCFRIFVIFHPLSFTLYDY